MDNDRIVGSAKDFAGKVEATIGVSLHIPWASAVR